MEDTMHALQKLMNNVEVGGRSYSGRGMNVDCLGFTMDLNEFIHTYTIALREYGSDLTDDEWDEIELAISGLRTDSMGRGTIVYFPTARYTDDGNDETEDEDDLRRV